MPIGIIGLPLSGKTTLFNALTRGHAEVAAFRSAGQQPNLGVVKVPDARLEALAEISRPRRIVQAEVSYIDIPAAPEGVGTTTGIDGAYLNTLQRCDALLLVARAFDDPSVPAVGAIDPYRDVETLQAETVFADLGILERRAERIGQQLRATKASERDALERESTLIKTMREGLEADIPIREQELGAGAHRVLSNFQLLSAKPLMVVFNIGEPDIERTGPIEREMAERLARPGVAAAAICGRLEMELAQMEQEEEAAFRESLGAGESGLGRMVRLSYSLLGLISFLTTGEDETRAWPIADGTVAVDAAGKVHSDIQRGFIRAEVVAYEELVAAGSIAEARRRGALRQEGKRYIVRDGDVVNFLFNV